MFQKKVMLEFNSIFGYIVKYYICIASIPNAPLITQKISEKELMLQFNCFYVINHKIWHFHSTHITFYIYIYIYIKDKKSLFDTSVHLYNFKEKKEESTFWIVWFKVLESWKLCYNKIRKSSGKVSSSCM